MAKKRSKEFLDWKGVDPKITKDIIELASEHIQGHLTLLGDGDRSLLHFAVEQNKPHVIETLVKVAGLDPNQVPACGSAPIHVAAQKNHVNVVEPLIKSGANPNQMNSYGWSPLHIACSLQNLEVLEPLIMNGANPRQSRSAARHIHGFRYGGKFCPARETAFGIARKLGRRHPDTPNACEVMLMKLMAKFVCGHSSFVCEIKDPKALGVVTGCKCFDWKGTDCSSEIIIEKQRDNPAGLFKLNSHTLNKIFEFLQPDVTKCEPELQSSPYRTKKKDWGSYSHVYGKAPNAQIESN